MCAPWVPLLTALWLTKGYEHMLFLLPSTPFLLPHQTSAFTLIRRSQLSCYLFQEAPPSPMSQAGSGPPRGYPHTLCVSHHRPVIFQDGSFLPTLGTWQGPYVYQKPTACPALLGTLPTSFRWSHPFQRGKLRPEGDTTCRGGQQEHSLQLGLTSALRVCWSLKVWR